MGPGRDGAWGLKEGSTVAAQGWLGRVGSSTRGPGHIEQTGGWGATTGGSSERVEPGLTGLGGSREDARSVIAPSLCILAVHLSRPWPRSYSPFWDRELQSFLPVPSLGPISVNTYTLCCNYGLLQLPPE